MKKNLFIVLIALSFIVTGFFCKAYTEEITKEDFFFLSSLHYSARGMGYWYDKANGGLETLTGIPYSNLSCKNCHAPSCDACHKSEADKKLFYTIKAAQNMDTCLHCHKREASIMQIDNSANQTDVHFVGGMQCADCHTAREAHGDGTEYNSMKQSGALDAKCENCHKTISPSSSHTVHKDKLDCKSCHVRHVMSCANCHFEALLKEGKRVAIPLSGWTFLMNYNGKVTSANLQTFVVKDNKTFLMFAPQNSHSIMKEGRKCGDCHATKIVDQVQKGRVALMWLENKEVKNLKGVIPVVDGTTYDCVYEDFQNGKWIPIENPPKPMLHYAGYGTPLSQEQMKKLAMPMGNK